jgi:hypothetical protein
VGRLFCFCGPVNPQLDAPPTHPPTTHPPCSISRNLPPGTRRRKARLVRVLNSSASNSKGGLTAKAAGELAKALESAVFDAAALQRKVDAFVAGAWAALGPSYLQAHETEVLSGGGARAAAGQATFGGMAAAAAAAAEPEQPQPQAQQPRQGRGRGGVDVPAAAAAPQPVPATPKAAPGPRVLRSTQNAPPLMSLPRTKRRGQKDVPQQQRATPAAATGTPAQQRAAAAAAATPGSRGRPATRSTPAAGGDAGAGPSSSRRTPSRAAAEAAAVAAAAAAPEPPADDIFDDPLLKRRKTVRWEPEETELFIQLVYRVSWKLGAAGGWLSLAFDLP